MTLISKFKKRFYFTVANYFIFFANFSLKRWAPRTIIVTGSAGKTTMLNLLELQLGKKAHYSHDANSAFGVAFDVLGLRGVTGSKWHWLSLFVQAPIRALTFTHREKYYVVELDGERPREAELVSRWLRPEISCWVSLGRSHAVFYEHQVESGEFDNIDDAIAHEFATVANHTRELILIDGDNQLMRKHIQNERAKIVEVHRSDLKKYTVCATESHFVMKNGRDYTFCAPMPRDVVTQLLMMCEVMDYLKLKPVEKLDQYRLPPGRSSHLKGKKGIDIIDSSYNAHIISMTTVLEMAKALEAKHKWLVIGDIIDQGQLEKEEHEKLAGLLAAVGAERIVMIGRRTKNYTLPLLKKQAKNVVSFDRPQQALEYLQQEITGDETLIFKGSQYLEWIIEKLLADPSDRVKLCRQDEAHRRRRASWGLN